MSGSKKKRGPRPRLFAKNRCQVDGCETDLSDASFYYQRWARGGRQGLGSKAAGQRPPRRAAAAPVGCLRRPEGARGPLLPRVPTIHLLKSRLRLPGG